MIKAFLLSLMMVAFARAETPPEITIRSAEQAIARFQKLRDTELKTSLKGDQLSMLLRSGERPHLDVNLCSHEEFVPGGRTDPLSIKGSDGDLFRLVGTFAVVARNENPVWCLRYLDGKPQVGSGLAIYIDAVTGKILYLCAIIGG